MSRLSEHVSDVLDDVRHLRRRFATTAPRAWDPSTAAAELSVQVGHLALCLLRDHGADVTGLEDPRRPLEDVGDELADIVLAALSITVLARCEPIGCAEPPRAETALDAFLRLLVAAGTLSEAALVEHHYRHRPEGSPQLLGSEPLTIRHRWVPGPNLLDAANHTEPASFAAAVAEIAHWIRALDGSDARLDANLANFCLTDDRPVLVDVLPPLIPSLRPKPVNLFDELFAVLCFDTPVLLDAFLGYALRACLHTPNRTPARELLPVVRDFAADDDADAGFPATWFRVRLQLAASAACGEVAVESVHDFFSLTSVLGFGQLSEHARRHRIDAVARRIQEWS